LSKGSRALLSMTHIHIKIRKTLLRSVFNTIGGFVLVLIAVFSLYQLVYANRIYPRIQIGTLDVGSLTREAAIQKIKVHQEEMEVRGLAIDLDGSTEEIRLEDIGFAVSLEESVNRAWALGRDGPWYHQLAERLKAPLAKMTLGAEIELSRESLENEIATIAELRDDPRRDIRFHIEGGEVAVLFDTRPGKLVARAEMRDAIFSSLNGLNPALITLSLEPDKLRADPNTVEGSKEEAERILEGPLTLVYKGWRFVVDREKIGSWISSGYEESRLVPLLNEEAISAYVTEIAGKLNTAPQDVRVRVVNDKVVDFVAPQSGRTLKEDETIKLIIDTLDERRFGKETTREISLPVTIKKPLIDETASSLGVTELFGEGATTFTGSPKNRIHNIKNGVKFLSGILIPPGEEFSTIESLGRISNTTGYLPELVIKGNRTIPEYGGGLCQVSTTLFRAVLNAGLPITARRNHSYRVSYYEKDAEGNFIGPGLDATIYSPNPDFRFLNDTDSTILVQGVVEGDKITFSLYGTKDGRVAEVDGPHTLSTFGAGAPIYVDTDTLKKGVTKRLETAHAGGTAVATYKVTYPDGEVNEQEFKSYYRGWPARYLVGTR